MVAEVEVAGLVEGHEVDVGVGHVDAHDGFADLDAGTDLLEATGHLLGEEVELAEEVVVEVEDVVDFLLGDAEYMSADDRIDVEEGEAPVGLGHTVARDFTGHNLGENAGHGYRSILVSSKVILPAGTLTSTTSPTLWPRKAEAKGEVMLILPCLRLASLSGTMV